MPSSKKAKLNFKWYNFIFLTLAGIINAFGVVIFISPCGLYDGGFSGTSILLSQVTPVHMSIFLLILNFPFFMFGLKKLGGEFIVYSLFTVAVYSLFSFLFQSVIPFDFSDGSPIAGNDMLLGSIFGGVISGIGSGLTIRFGGAIDGIEVLTVTFAKKLGLTVGTFVMIFNVILYTIAGFVTKSFQSPLYSVIAYAIGLKAVDFMIEGFDKAKSAYIITEHDAEVAERLSEVFGRGLTLFDAHGYYSHSEKTVLFCVVNRFEINQLKTIVSSIDPKAFIVVNDVTDTMGNSLKYDRVLRRLIAKKKTELGNTIPKELLKMLPPDGAPNGVSSDSQPSEVNAQQPAAVSSDAETEIAKDESQNS